MDSKNCFSLILLGQPVLTSLMMRQLNLILTKAFTIGAQNNKLNIDSDIVLAAVNDIALA